MNERSILLLRKTKEPGKIGGVSMDKKALLEMLQHEKDLYENKQIENALKKDNEKKESYLRGVVEGLSIAIAMVKQQS